MSSLSTLLRSRWMFCSIAVVLAGVFVVGGCPPVNNNPDPNNVDPNSSNTDPNTTDPNTGGGIDDPNSGANNGGGGGGGGTVVDPNTTNTTAPTKLGFERLVQTGEQVPDQPSGVTFSELGTPVIDSKGRVAFWALYTGSGKKGNGGLYVWEAGHISCVVDDDPGQVGIVPGRTTNDYFGPFTASNDPAIFDLEMAWGAGDRLLFVSPIAGEKSTVGIYRWRATDGNIVRVAEREQVAATFPDTPGAPDYNTFAPTFSIPGVSDNGIAIFGVSYLYLVSGDNPIKTGQGVFKSNGTTVSVIADTRHSTLTPGDVPGQDPAANAYFTSIDVLTTLNGAGDRLFTGAYTGGEGARGIYLSRGDTNYRVIDTRSDPNWPGLTNTRITAPIRGFAIGPNGHIAVSSQVYDSDGGHRGVILWNWGTSSWTQLKGENNAFATALLTGVNDDGECVILADSVPYLVSASTRTNIADALPSGLKSAGLTWPEVGGAINDAGRAVLPYTRSDSSPGLAFYSGSGVFIAADAALNTPQSGITAITTVTGVQRDRPSRSGMFNDADELVFLIDLASGQEIWVARGE